MTAETLHDALTLLPADLVAGADRRRRREKAAIPLRRWAAMAACFVLVLTAGSVALGMLAPRAADTAAQQAPAAAAPEAYAMDEETSQRANGDAAPAEKSEAAIGFLPVLTLGDADHTIALEAWGFEWSEPKSDGSTVTVHADVAAPVDAAEKLVCLDIAGGSLDLLWAELPQSLTVRCWQFDGTGWTQKNADLAERDTLTVYPGEHIYELRAVWQKGYTTYAFRVIAPAP